MDGINVNLDDIDMSGVLRDGLGDETQKSGRWAVQEPDPKDVLAHVDPVIRRMPRTRSEVDEG